MDSQASFTSFQDETPSQSNLAFRVKNIQSGGGAGSRRMKSRVNARSSTHNYQETPSSGRKKNLSVAQGPRHEKKTSIIEHSGPASGQGASV